MANPIRKINESIGDIKTEKDPASKLTILKKSLESGVISKEEFEKEKQPIEQELEEFEKKREEKIETDDPKKTDKSLIYVILAVLVILALIFAYSKFFKENPKTIEEMHILNLQGKLDPELGYVYKDGYSFVKFDEQWFTQIASPQGTKEYNLAFRYSPRELENVSIGGMLNFTFFNNEGKYYITFDPSAEGLQYFKLAVADLSSHIIQVFEKNASTYCDRNETYACSIKPIITCDTDKVVFYIKDAKQLRTYYNDSCIVIEGEGMDLVRGLDRILYNFYGIMDQG